MGACHTVRTCRQDAWARAASSVSAKAAMKESTSICETCRAGEERGLQSAPIGVDFCARMMVQAQLTHPLGAGHVRLDREVALTFAQDLSRQPPTDVTR